jgi:hypothetical protein
MFFGIDKNKELEISQVTKLENGLHYYLGWFHFKGKFQDKDCTIPLPAGGSTTNFEAINENF